MSYEFFWETIIKCLQVLSFVAVLFLSSLIGYGLYGRVTSSGRIEFCFVETYSSVSCPGVQYALKGFRNFRSDASLGTYSDIEKATKAAELINCQIVKGK